MSALTAIVKKAKVLYKTGKYAKWTDAIKAASKGTKKAAPKRKISGWKKSSTNMLEHGEKKRKGKNILVTRRKKGGARVKGTFKKFQTISGVMSAGKNILLDKLGKLEAKKFATPLKRDKNKIAKEIAKTKTQLRKFI